MNGYTDWRMRTAVYRSFLKRREILTSAVTWMNLEDLV